MIKIEKQTTYQILPKKEDNNHYNKVWITIFLQKLLTNILSIILQN